MSKLMHGKIKNDELFGFDALRRKASKSPVLSKFFFLISKFFMNFFVNFLAAPFLKLSASENTTTERNKRLESV